MNNVRILDCTLCDGGEINDWAFNDQQIIGIINSLIESRVDIIECGYLSEVKGSSNNSTLYDSIDTIEERLANTRLIHKMHPCVATIKHNEVDGRRLPPRSGDGLLSGFRVTFPKRDVRSGMTLVGLLLDKGYDVFVEPLVTVRYSDYELRQLAEEVARIRPSAMYVVDSFGSMEQDKLIRLFRVVDGVLPPDIAVGFHLHNNMQMAYTNAMGLCEQGNTRPIIIDASIYGMGKGAGNLNTELFAEYLNRLGKDRYRLPPFLEMIDSYLDPIRRDRFWGYTVAHFLSGVTQCHPDYASYLFEKRTLPVAVIRELLERIVPEERDSFNTQLIEQLYIRYQSERFEVQHDQELDLHSQPVLILATGTSVEREQSRVLKTIEDTKSMVICVNHKTNLPLKPSYYFFSNQKRYNEHGLTVEDPRQLIITSNINPVARHDGCFVVAFEPLFKLLEGHSDNASLLLIALLESQGVETTMVAGLDGYDIGIPYDHYVSHSGRELDRESMTQQNEQISSALRVIARKIRIKFLTPSRFYSCLPVRVLGVIPARYRSTRFKGKPLVKIKGIPMLLRTWNQVKGVAELDKLVVATDDERIRAFCESEGLSVVMTSPDCLTGTDRLAEVARILDYDLYVNIQGDEPVVSPETVSVIVNAFRQHGEQFIAYNLYREVGPNEMAESDTMIKVVVNENNELMYMSRHPIPFSKSGSAPVILKQVCVYGFTRRALDIFSQRSKTCNERFEDIEILRFLDLGYRVKMMKTDCDSIAVDRPEDVTKVEQFLEERGLQ